MNIVLAIETREAAKKISAWQKFKIEKLGRKIFVGLEMRSPFQKPQPFYLFWCDVCGRYGKDYPHGFVENRYLRCGHCDVKYDFTPWWLPWLELWHIIKFSVSYKKSA